MSASAAYSGGNAAHGEEPEVFKYRLLRIVSSGLLLVTTMLLMGALVAGINGVRIRVEQSGSMAPELNAGDLVLIRETPIGAVRVNDVIGVRTSTGHVIVHRVKTIDVGPTALRVKTQGDANPTGEMWTIRRSQHVALVKGSVPRLGSVIDALKGPAAAALVLLCGLILAAAALRSIWRRS